MMHRAQFAFACAALTVVVVCAPALASGQRTGDSETRRYRVAVVRADGVIVPFAEHENGYWRPVWAGVDRVRSRDLPMTLDAVEPRWWGKDGPALFWSLWERPGLPVALAVTAPRAVSTPCDSGTGLATDYKPAPSLPPATAAPYPKIGLATTAPIDFEPIVALDPASADWQRVRKAASRELPAAELRALYEMRWAHPTPERERNAAAFDLQNVWHVPGGPFYYFEAMRRYPERRTPRGEEPCDMVTYAAGYLWDDGKGELRGVGTNALVSYCHLERAVFMWPLGEIREGSRVYWVLQMAGWNSESYGVVEMLSARGEVRARHWHVAGQCQLR